MLLTKCVICQQIHKDGSCPEDCITCGKDRLSCTCADENVPMIRQKPRVSSRPQPARPIEGVTAAFTQMPLNMRKHYAKALRATLSSRNGTPGMVDRATLEELAEMLYPTTTKTRRE